MRRREAQGCCPGLEVLARDLAGEARKWEPAVAAVEAFAPGVEVLQPGQLAFGARGPARYFGGGPVLAVKVAAAVKAAVAGGEGVPAGWAGCCRVGLADGLFAAGLAASMAGPGEPMVVPEGKNAEFLAPLPLMALAGSSPGSPGSQALVDLLQRLGLGSLGDFASLAPASVLGRLGEEGIRAHRLARGLSERPVKGRVPPPDWVVAAALDPPAEQLQAAVFVGRVLAEQLHERLAGRGLVCTRLAIEAETDQGVTLRRSWRHEGALSAAAIGERVRWQLEGWSQGLLGRSGRQAQVPQPQPGRVTRLALLPEEVRPDSGRQLGFWGEDASAGERSARALARVQSLLGPEAALSAVLQGGRDYKEQVLFVPWGEPREPLRAGAGPGRGGGPKVNGPPPPPWPGRLPGLAPAVVHRSPLRAEVLDAAGKPVSVSSRGVVSAPPASVTFGDVRRPLTVSAWAGPWPLEERWWDAGGRRRARLQVLTAEGATAHLLVRAHLLVKAHLLVRAYLLVRESGSWWVEATYD